jgi:hypothetical protein
VLTKILYVPRLAERGPVLRHNDRILGMASNNGFEDIIYARKLSMQCVYIRWTEQEGILSLVSLISTLHQDTFYEPFATFQHVVSC